MINIREEKATDIAARERLLDTAYGAACFAKTSERLREGRLPANSLLLVAIELRPGALAGAHGLIGATGQRQPQPDLMTLVASKSAAHRLMQRAA